MNWKIIILLIFVCYEYSLAQKPDILWQLDLKSMAFGNACAGDIDGDGKLEIVFATYFNDETIYALNAEDGSVLWKYNTGGCNDAAPLIVDVDCDGSMEVILHSSTSPYIYCFNGKDGTIKWKTSSVGTDSPPSAADLNNDKKYDIFGGDFYARLFRWNGEDGSIVWSKQVDSNATVQTEPVIADVNGDGELDCVVATWKRESKNRISAYRLRDGELIWSCNEPSSMLYHGPVILDLDGDDNLEVVIGSYDGILYCLNGKDGSIKWTFNYPEKRYIGPPTTAADLNGDGLYEIAFISGNKLGILDNKGKLLWDYDMGLNNTSFRGAIFTDLDNKEGLDVLFGTMLGKLIALKGNDGSKIFEYDMSKEFGNSFNIDHAPIVADFNNDGMTDIFFVGGYAEYPNIEKNYGRAYMITIGKTQGPDWLMFRNNIRRNAVIPINQLSITDEKKDNKLNIFPNPANEYIDISYIINPTVNHRVDVIGESEIRIYNVLGECMITICEDGRTHPLIPSQEGNLRISISNLPSGLYYVRLGDWEGSFVKIE
ncbi:MAG: PQQ-binding-like beta-propeller repeat protein [Candidatus Kapabacteria bacterium]|nr:PQQ-binding-like beta-propeller repeat protein [Candidatus Kapabacteria bacterium]